jgi:3-oxoacyl-[acyl-carrier-protein] synthase-3
VLLVTGEKRLPSLAGVLGVSTAIGEASAACLIGLGGSGDRVLSYADRTRGVPHEPTWEEYPNIAMARYVEDLVYVIGEALRRANTGISDIDMVIPHNVSRMLWYRTSEALGIDRRRPIGHCYCSDPFLNLVAMAEGGRLVPGRRYLLTSVGLGATHTAVVIECRRR